MISKEKQRIKVRSIIVGCVFSLFLGVVGAKAVYVQVVRRSWLSEKAANQYEKSYRLQGKRGTIFDANLQEMAVSVDVTSIAVHPKKISNPRSASTAISSALRERESVVAAKLTSGRPFEWLKRKVTPKEAKKVEELAIEGIEFLTEHSRFYPNKTLAAQVIGFSGIDGHGLEGLEYHYDKYLRGAPYTYKVLEDALGRGFRAESDVSPDHYYSGNNLILTIDLNIQFIAEKALEETVTQFMAKSGMAVVMSPKTGAVLAMAHFPAFNPNAYGKYDKDLWRNRVITDPFEPGSTMKIFSVAAAIEAGICRPTTVFSCENGKYAVGRNVVHDTHPHDRLSVEEIVKLSSNIGAVKISALLGPERLYTCLKRFGFGQKSGIDCSGETSGMLWPYQRWTPIDTATISFGQGISVSALQLLNAACAIANNGVLMKPFIVQAITNQSGRLIQRFGPAKIGRAISEETAEAMRKMMKTVTMEGGTGVNAAIEGYTVCGKTGTAQKIDENGGYARGRYMAAFLGFAPEENASAAVLVVVDEPKNQYYGGIVAAPAFKKIMGETLNYLNIPPAQKGDTLTARLTRGTSE